MITSSQQFFLDDQRFQFEIFPFEMKNSLGKVVAILQEYIITRYDSGFGPSTYKLYKTKEGNWYEIESENVNPDKIIRDLKYAINSIEDNYNSVLQ